MIIVLQRIKYIFTLLHFYKIFVYLTSNFKLHNMILSHKLFWLIIIVLLPLLALSEIKTQRLDSIIVIENGDTLLNAFAGGFNAPQFSATDLNNDGFNDLFVFDREGGIIRTFLNIDNKGTYKYAPEYISAFPDTLSGFTLMLDYNCDGYDDLFSYISGGIALYKNEYAKNNKLSFSLASGQLLSDYGLGNGLDNIYVAPTNIPAIVDIDNDGDIDILSFAIASQFLAYHQNQSMELYGHCDSLVFKVADACWGKFSENSSSNSVNLGVTCRNSGLFGSGIEDANGGTSLLAVDLDSDGDKDYLQGQILFKSIVMATNGGDSSAALMTSQTLSYPTNTSSVYMSFPAMFSLDVDHDGKKDMIAATNTTIGSPNVSSAWFYKNTSTTDSAVLSIVNTSFLQEGMIEVGSGANPVFFDYNSDGLFDLVIGNYGYYNPNGLYDGKLALYENIGTATKPAFKKITSDYQSISSLMLNGLYPTFGDLDGDGDEDMILGESDGRLYYYENTAGTGNVAAFSLKEPKFSGIDVGQFSAPQLIDIDKDGLLDLLIGERSGNLNYYHNNGTASLPSFNATADNDFFGGIDVMIPCCTGYSSPFVYRNLNNKLRLFVGSENGTIYQYGNIDNNLTGTFTLLDSIPLNSLRTSISMTDLDHDGFPELVYGEYTGGCSILRLSDLSTSIGQQKPTKRFDIYPNPTEGNLIIKPTSLSENFSLSLVDLLGKELLSIPNQNQTLILNTEKFEQGIYIITIRNQSSVISERIIVIN